MSVLFAFLGALAAGFGAFWATKKWPQDSGNQKLAILCISGASLAGFLCGWLIPERVPFWTNHIRLLFILAVLGGTTYTDLRSKSIPNVFPLFLLAGFAVTTVLDLLVIPESAVAVVIGGVVSGVLIFLILLLFRFLSRGGIGFGDIKLMAAMGTLLGMTGTISTLFLAQISALLVAFVLILARKVTMKDSLPFAPFFYVGFLMTLCLGTF